MSLKTYIPSGIKSATSSIKESGSTISANYFTTDLVRPTAISRNLLQLNEGGVVAYDIDVASPEIPSNHSSGNPMKSRSFDYDLVLGNVDTSTDNNFLILDIGSRSWFLKYYAKVSVGAFYRYKFKVVSVEQTDDKPLGNASYKLINLSNYGEHLSPVLRESSVEGYAIGYTLVEYNYKVGNYNEEIDGVSTPIVEIAPSKLLNDLEEAVLTNTDILTAFQGTSYGSNLRFLSDLPYTASINDFSIPDSTTNYLNLRDLSEVLDVKSYAAFTGKVSDLTGFLFNFEIFYNSQENLLDTLQSFDESLGDSSLNVFSGEERLYAYKELYFRNTSGLTAITLSKSPAEIIASVNLDQTSDKELFELLREKGICCLLAKEEDVVTGAYIRVLFNNSDDFYVTVEGEDEGTAFTSPLDNLSIFDKPLVNKPNFLKAYPSTLSGDSLSKTYRLSKNLSLVESSNVSSISLSNTKSNVVTINDASDLVTLTNPVEVPLDFTTTDFFNNGYGVTKALEDIRSAIELNTDVTAQIQPGYASMYVDCRSSAISNLSFKGTEVNLTSSSQQAFCSEDQVLLTFNNQARNISPTPAVSSLPYVILDLYKLTSLEVNPFAYITDNGSLIKEQSTATINVSKPKEATLDVTIQSLSRNLSTSLVSNYLLPILPLYDESKVFSGCVAVFYDAAEIDGQVLKSTLLRESGSSYVVISPSGVDRELSYISAYTLGEPKYTKLDLQSISLHTETYYNIYSENPAHLYGTLVELAIDNSAELTLKVSDKLGTVLEESKIISSEVLTLDSKYLSISSTTLPGIINITLKESLEDTRYVLEMKGATVYTSQVFNVTSSSSVIPLNRSA